MENENKCPKCDRAGRARADGSFRCRYDGTEWSPKTTTRKVAKKETPTLPPEVKALSKKLGQANIKLQELRQRKKAGEDVKNKIRDTLTYLRENRAKKREMMESRT